MRQQWALGSATCWLLGGHSWWWAQLRCSRWFCRPLGNREGSAELHGSECVPIGPRLEVAARGRGIWQSRSQVGSLEGELRENRNPSHASQDSWPAVRPGILEANMHCLWQVEQQIAVGWVRKELLQGRAVKTKKRREKEPPAPGCLCGVDVSFLLQLQMSESHLDSTRI